MANKTGKQASGGVVSWKQTGKYVIESESHYISKQAVGSVWVYALWTKRADRFDLPKCLWVGSLDECKEKAL